MVYYQKAKLNMRHKYPRTPHLPFSFGRTSGDRVLSSLATFEGQHVAITLKMDGENTSLYRDCYHARSLDSRHHPSRDWLKSFHATFAHEIPLGWRVCGENLYARHSLTYTDLPSYFMGFSVWDENNVALSWDDTVECFEVLGVTPVPVLYRGEFDEARVRDLAMGLDTHSQEGLVVRLSGPIRYEDFGQSVAKWVRPAHVQTDQHWMHGPLVPNGLAPLAAGAPGRAGAC